jgi:hypothetical protein
MTDEVQALVESHNEEAAHASAIAKEAGMKAISANMLAALQEYFESRSSGRFIDINRIPFICDDIKGIHQTQNIILENQALTQKAQEKTQNDLYWIKWIGSGFVMAAGMLAMKALGV